MPIQLPRLRSLTFSAVILASLTALKANADTLYWDTNGATAGAGVTADGTWDTGITANWTSDSTGSSAPTTFTAGDDIIFSAGTDMTTASIAVSGTQTVNSLTFKEGTVSLSGSEIDLAANSIVTVNSGANAISSGAIKLLGNTEFAISGSFTSSQTIGAGKILTKTGSGTLTLSDTNNSDYFISANEGLLILQRTHWKQLKASSVNSGGTLRIAANEQFGSDLAVNTGGILELNANITETVASLSGAGSITGGSNSTLGATGGTFSGTIAGDLDFVKSGTGTHTFSGTSTSSGDITVSAGTYTLASTGSLTFYIGADGISNKVTGTGTATFDGAFNFDLTNATLADGNSWTIVNTSTLTESFASTFLVNDFIQDNDVWTNGAGLSFSESTGILSYSAIPEPSSYALFAGMIALTAIGFRRRV